MVADEFHEKPFDGETVQKLKIFQGYLREWIPVFTASESRREVVIFDFFSGPGTDADGKPGSPLIIADEVSAIMKQHRDKGRLSPTVRLVFNDAEASKIDQLTQTLKRHDVAGFCKLEFKAQSFEHAFEEYYPQIESDQTACLVIMDQFGIKHVTSDVFCRLVACRRTDLMFFVSSSYIKRFIDQPSFSKYIKLSPDVVKLIPTSDIHRFLCHSYYREMIPAEMSYHLAPFSIKKDGTGNIYGIIFGSGSPLGLEKFLQVCWKLDEVSGEANFNIDNALGADSLPFPEFSIPEKHQAFRDRLCESLQTKSMSNCDVYLFALENGFLPKQARAVLRALVDDKCLEVQCISARSPVRANAFYLSWKDFGNAPRVRFVWKGSHQ